MAKEHLWLVTPTTDNRTVEMPARLANSEYRTREYLTKTEVAKLIEAAAKKQMEPSRRYDDSHLLQAWVPSERAVRPSMVRFVFKAATMHVRRLKGSTDAVNRRLRVRLA